MSERTKAEARLTEKAVGGPLIWNGLTGEPRPGQFRELGLAVSSFVARQPIEITGEIWDTTETEASAIYEFIMSTIDWNRVLLAASGRHLDQGHPEDTYIGYLCGECLQHALLDRSAWEK